MQRTGTFASLYQIIKAKGFLPRFVQLKTDLKVGTKLFTNATDK
jgi:hypothetical protein